MSQTKVQLIDGFDIDTSVPADSLVIDSSGNVGIGNSNPSSLLTLGGNDTTGSSQKITYKAGSTDAASIEFVTEEGGINRDAGIKLNVMQNNSLFTLLYAEGTNGGRVGIGTTSPEELVHINASSSGALVDLLKIDNSGGAIGTEAGIVFECGVDRTARISSENTGSDLGALKFWTAGSVDTLSERMRIDSTGRIGINTNVVYDINNASLAVAAAWPRTPIEVQSNVSTGHYALTFRNANGLVGNIITDGSSTSFNTSSDYRLKENVVDIVDGITRVKQLQPKRFNFITDADTIVDGFLAYEAQAVVPECVTGTKDEVDDDGNPVYQGIDQSKLVPLLTAALQEAIGEIESLKDRVAALEAN